MNTTARFCRPARLAVRAAFSLVELLTVIALLAILAAILIPVTQSVRHQAQVSQSTNMIRGLGTASLLYASDHDGKWPRSTHSTVAGERNWSQSLSRYLWPVEITSKYDPRFAAFKAARLRDPLDLPELPGDVQRNEHSYGFNVHLQLEPDMGDNEYAFYPARWQRVSQVPAPASTVLFASNRLQTSDHFMAHNWDIAADAEHDLDVRDGDKAPLVFCDGHVAWMKPADTYDPTRQIDRWNPVKAATSP